MKTSHKLVGAALLAAVGVSVALPGATKAAPEAGSEFSGNGKIVFTKDNTSPTVEPPGKTGPEIEGPANPADLDLKILYVSDLDFDQNELLTHGSVKTYDALPNEATVVADGSAMTTPNFVQFQDYRTEVENKYKISAAITQQFTNGTHVMDNAKLNYSNATWMSANNSATMPTSTIANFTVTDTKADVVTVNEAGKGYGKHDIAFGGYDDTAAKSVQLEIPGDVILAAGEYQAEITWYIEDAN